MTGNLFGFGVEASRATISGFFDRLGKEFSAHALDVGHAAAAEFEAAVRDSIRRLLNKRPTGELAESVASSVLTDSDGRIIMRIGPRKIYGRIQNEGGTIEGDPKLAVPLPWANVPRGTWPRDMPDLFLVKRKGKDPLLARRNGKETEFLFVLKDSVTIPATHYLEEALAEAEDDAKAAALSKLQSILDRAR